jgi:hypothetical protein
MSSLDESLLLLIQLGDVEPGPSRDELVASSRSKSAADNAQWAGADRQAFSTPDKVLGCLLTQAEHRALARGLVLATEAHALSCGSVDAAVSVNRLFAERYPEHADELADWMMKHSTNPYVRQSIRGSARSLGEYRLQQEEKRINYAEHLTREDQQEALSAARKSVRIRVSNHESRLKRAAADMRNELIRELADLPQRWLGKSAHGVRWNFCLRSA